MTVFAADVYRAIRQRRFRSSTSLLANLTAADADAVAQALSRARVSPRAKIDVGRLIETIKREREAAVEAEREARASQPNRYALLLAAQEASAGLPADDPSPGDHPDQLNPPVGDQPKSNPRTWSRRTGEPKPTAARKTPAARPGPPPEPFYVGPRAFGADADDRPYGAPIGCDYAAWRNPAKPPWLISSGDEDASNAITDDVLGDDDKLDED